MLSIFTRFLCFHHPPVSAKALCFGAVRRLPLSIRLFVCLDGSCYLNMCVCVCVCMYLICQIRYLTNGLSNLDVSYREYLLAPADDLIRFWK